MMSVDQDVAHARKEKADEPGPIVSRVIVDVQGIKGDVGRWVDLVKNLIFIQEGEPFSTKRFQDSLEALKSSKIFKAIHAFEKSVKEDQLILHFQVTPYPRVKDIKIRGAFPLLEREILNAMQLSPGNEYNPETFSAKEAAIVQLFKKEGYIAPIVNLGATEDPADGNVVVYVNIDKGNFFHIHVLLFTYINIHREVPLIWSIRFDFSGFEYLIGFCIQVFLGFLNHFLLARAKCIVIYNSLWFQCLQSEWEIIFLGSW